ncbi:MAG: hypothetical protein ABMB14_17605, partial [Myxococcota bacterium]
MRTSPKAFAPATIRDLGVLENCLIGGMSTNAPVVTDTARAFSRPHVHLPAQELGMTPQTRKDLDTFCTAFIDRGGMGNGPSEMPARILYAIAANDSEVGAGEAAAYVKRFLARAGVEDQKIGWVFDDVSDTIRIVQDYLSQTGEIDTALEWARRQPVHKAADPAMDPRWSRPALNFTRGASVQAWIHATKEELDETGLASGAWAGGSMFWMCHREHGPAVTLYYSEGPNKGKVWEEYWIRHGELHRDGGLPAIVAYDRDDSVMREEW